MEIIYSATTSAWIGIASYNGRSVVFDDSFEYVDCLDRAIICEGTYEKCQKFADEWEAESRVTW